MEVKSSYEQCNSTHFSSLIVQGSKILVIVIHISLIYMKHGAQMTIIYCKNNVIIFFYNFFFFFDNFSFQKLPIKPLFSTPIFLASLPFF